MKYLLIILSVLFSTTVFSQGLTPSRTTAGITAQDYRLKVPMNFIPPSGVIPSLNGGLTLAGGLYYNTTDTSLYTYDSLHVKWQRLLKLSDTTYLKTIMGSSVWGNIQGILSNQTDLQNALNAKQNTITLGTTAQYFRGNLSLATFPTTVSTFTNDAGYLTSSTGVPSSRTLTINGTTFDLSANRTWNVGTVTSIGAIAGFGIKTITGSPITGAGSFTIAVDSSQIYTKRQVDSLFTVDTLNIYNVGVGINMGYGTSNSINFSRLQQGLGMLITKQTDSSTKVAVDTSGTNGVALKSWALANISPNAYVQNGNSFGGLATIGTNDANNFAIKTGGAEIFRFLNGGGFTDSTGRQFYKYRLRDTTSLANLFIGDDESISGLRTASARLQIRGKTNLIGEKLIYVTNSLNQAPFIVYSSYQAQLCDALFGAGGTTLNNSQYTFTGSNSAATAVTSIRLTKSTTTTATSGKQIEVAVGPVGAGATFGPSTGSADYSNIESQGNISQNAVCTGFVVGLRENLTITSSNYQRTRAILTNWRHVQFGGGEFSNANSRSVTGGTHLDAGFPVTTTNATPTNIDTIPTSAGQAYVMTFEIKVLMGSTYSFFTRKVRCSNNAGTITAFPLQGIGTDDIGSGMSGISFSTATSGNDLYLVITGLAATTLVTSTIKHYGEFR